MSEIQGLNYFFHFIKWIIQNKLNPTEQTGGKWGSPAEKLGFSCKKKIACSTENALQKSAVFCRKMPCPECTKIARSSAVAAAIFTAPPQNRAIFRAPRCAISSAKKIASERRFSLRFQGPNLIPTAEFPAIPESAAKVASERRCAILVHSGHVLIVLQKNAMSYRKCGFRGARGRKLQDIAGGPLSSRVKNASQLSRD